MKLSDFSPSQYDVDFAKKLDLVHSYFPDYQDLDFTAVSSSYINYRLRAEFRVWHDGLDLYYVVFDAVTGRKIRVDDFPVASVLINKAMPILISYIKRNPILKNKIFQIDFLSTLSNQLLISLIYHKKLDDSWVQEAVKLELYLTQKLGCVSVIGLAKKQQVTLTRDYVLEKIKVQNRLLEYKQFANSFTQPNGFVAPKMLEWAAVATDNLKGDLLELYCGNGNFAIALAANFRQVLATEVTKKSVVAALDNIKLNQCDNVKIARLSAQEFTAAYNKERVFRRLEGIDLGAYDFSTILIDPPRAGVDADTLKLVARFKNIIYISCNIDTLLANLNSLTATHKITKLAFFDQFPYTKHMEFGVALTAKS